MIASFSMFTGIVEGRGTVESIGRAEPARTPAAPADAQPEETESTVVRLVVKTALDVAGLPIGASIAVDGVCLTIVDRAPGRFAADLGPETLMLTTLGALEPGRGVHLERPLRLGDPLGGHLVAGHVDAIGTVAARNPKARALDLEIAVPASVAPVLAPKGSIAVDGVSLTINTIADLGEGAGAVFSVTLIPHTLASTHLGERGVGSAVNIEADLIAKHIERLVRTHLSLGGALAGAVDRSAAMTPARPLSIETLRRYGFVR
jgi:riboflavin synthase